MTRRFSKCSRVVERQQAQLASTRAAAAEAARTAALAKQELQRAREDHRAAEETWRRQRVDYERARTMSDCAFSRSDPYLRAAGRHDGLCQGRLEAGAGLPQEGAHDLDLRAPDASGVQRLDITEHDNVFKFDLAVPDNVSSLGALIPLV